MLKRPTSVNLEDVWRILQTTIFGTLLTRNCGAKESAMSAEEPGVADTTTIYLAGRIRVTAAGNKHVTALDCAKRVAAKDGNIMHNHI